MMVRVTYNHSYPVGRGEWHNYNKEEAVDVEEFTVKAIQEAIDKHENDVGNNSIIKCMPIMEE